MPKKLSEIAKKMATSVLRKKDASLEAVSVALKITHLAWNYADEDYKDEPGYIHGIREIKNMMPPIKNEFIIDDVERLFDTLMKYKKTHYQGYKKIIFSCEYEDGTVRVTRR